MLRRSPITRCVRRFVHRFVAPSAARFAPRCAPRWAPRNLTCVVTRVLVAVVAIVAIAGSLPALAQDTTPWSDWSVEAPGPEWRTWVAADAGAGFALLLPPGHTLAYAGSDSWYLHGRLDGMPTVPDASIRWLAGVDLVDARAESFPDDAIAEPWRFGDDATRGLRIVAPARGRDGAAYTQAGYLIAHDDGVLRISRYEGFDWAPFHAVAGSVRWVLPATTPGEN